MDTFKNIPEGEKILYKDNVFSGDYDQQLFIKRSNDDGSNRPKFFISASSLKNGELEMQGYLYFYLDQATKSSSFIGIKVNPLYRDLNIGSFLVASWIDMCLNNGYDFLGVNPKQRKPFLLYLLKTYGFEILDKSLYETRPEVITICRSLDKIDRTKYLAFKDSKHEKVFTGTNSFKEDNYSIIHTMSGYVALDNVLLPLQNQKKLQVGYQLLDKELAVEKMETTIRNHTK